MFHALQCIATGILVKKEYHIVIACDGQTAKVQLR